MHPALKLVFFAEEKYQQALRKIKENDKNRI